MIDLGLPILCVLGLMFVLLLGCATHRRGSLVTLGLAAAALGASGAGVSVLALALGSPDSAFTTLRSVTLALVLGLTVAAPGALLALRRNPWLGALLAWAALSLWHVDNFAQGVVSLVGLLGAMLLGGLLAARPLRSAALAVAVGLALAVGVSLASIVFTLPFATTTSIRPGEGLTVVNLGLYVWNSDLGVAAGVLTVLSLWLGMTSARAWWVAATLGLIGLTVADSATATAATAIAVAVLTWSRLRALVGPGVFVVAVVGLLLLAGVVRLPVDLALDALGRSANLTGRTQIWQYVIDQINDEPIMGHGVGAEPDLERVFGFVGHAHNGYLELAFALGYVGAALFLGALVVTVRKAWGNPLLLALLTLFLASNMANNYLVASHLVVTVFAWVAASKRERSDAPVADRKAAATTGA